MAERRKKTAVDLRGRAGAILVLALIGLILLCLGRMDRDGEEPMQSTQAWQDDIAALEEKAAALCSRVAGVGEVSVAISLAQGVEYVYAEDDGGYLRTGGSTSAGLLLTERPPQISGIGVVCTGADDPAVVQKLVSLLSAAFGVGSNRIYITAAG